MPRSRAPKRASPESTAPSAFVIYWGGDAYLSDPLTVGDTYRWTGNKDAKKGDLAFLYVTSPVSALVGEFEVVSDGTRSDWAGRFQAHPYSMKVRLVRAFDEPLRLAVMRMDPVLSQWGLVRGSMQMPFGRPPRVPPEIVARLERLMGTTLPPTGKTRNPGQ